ncbi:hypothetical protein BWZ20_02265 [Winogradskyella sp. J14-2]|uniref:ATP-grasp domain-containing protein n=1 Tax=Winogradskyella sp. J14-2 TaxID=1936080 RepID=UPI000972B25D|nr:ATP-grasp domain-containing protein [Winogradskyella sp. J14-2]APY07199.1 hypothetical protein BWZ20_02265 [Winogradskyella sp. J14-2]
MRVLVLDANNPIFFDLAFCLRQGADISIIAMSSKKNTPMRWSLNIDKYIYVENLLECNNFKKVEAVVKQEKIDCIIPIGEQTCLGFLGTKKFIYKDKLILISDYQTYFKAINKDLLYYHLKENNINHPNTVIIKSTANDVLLESISKLNFPLIAKPVRGIDGNGILEISNSKALKVFLDSRTINQYLLQEYVNGYDIDCSVLCKNGNILSYTIQKGMSYEYKKFTAPISLTFLKEPKLFLVVKKLIQTLKWSGIAHIDLRYDKITDDFKIIEVNARYWGSLHASYAAGINFPVLHCYLSMGKDLELNSFLPIQYYSLKSVLTQPHHLIKSFIAKKKSYTQLAMLTRDPIPYIFKFFIRTYIILKRKFRQLKA